MVARVMRVAGVVRGFMIFSRQGIVRIIVRPVRIRVRMSPIGANAYRQLQRQHRRRQESQQIGDRSNHECRTEANCISHNNKSIDHIQNSVKLT